MSIASEETSTSVPTSGTYSIDPSHSRVGFSVRHAMISKVRGHFGDVEGSGEFDAEAPRNSQLSITIKSASIDTGNADRDAHVRNADFLDVETYPTITFASTSIDASGDGSFAVTGDLTIKGVTKPVTFDVELGGSAVDPWGHTRLGLEGRAVVSRKDWGLTWNAALETGGVIVSDKVTLEFEVEAIKA
jgi:polyisoprenoid-binding protein YceI